MPRARITAPGWENFTGHLGSHLFEQSLSVDDVPDSEIIRLSGIVAMEAVRDLGPATPAVTEPPPEKTGRYPDSPDPAGIMAWAAERGAEGLAELTKADLEPIVAAMEAAGFAYEGKKRNKGDLVGFLLACKPPVAAQETQDDETAPDPGAEPGEGEENALAGLRGLDAAELLALGTERLEDAVAAIEVETAKPYRGKRTAADLANFVARHLAG